MKVSNKWTIWKYVFPYRIFDRFELIDIPEKGEILHVGIQNENICLWIKVNTENKKEERAFILRGTDKELKVEEEYIGTVMDNSYVFHIFEQVDASLKERSDNTISDYRDSINHFQGLVFEQDRILKRWREASKGHKGISLKCNKKVGTDFLVQLMEDTTVAIRKVNIE
jgi:hypothetical protein